MSAPRACARRPTGGVALAVAAVLTSAASSGAQAQNVGRAAAERLRYPELSFEQPVPARHRTEGVTVLVLEDHSVPLVNLYVRFEGGYALLGRDSYGVGTGLPALLRYGGTLELTPTAVDERLEHYAIQTSFGGGGESMTVSANTLTEHAPLAFALVGDMLARPRFDPSEIEVWRGRQLESIRRLGDDPQRLAFSEFNRLLYGDHPIGWEMEDADLGTERVSREAFQDVHRRIVCRERMILGITGDLSWPAVEPLVATLVDKVPACEGTLPPSPIPDIRREPGVFLIERELEQSVIVMAHPTSVRLADDPAYFAVTIANSILGGGGFSSRIMGRVRTQEGFAYSAGSLWTTPRRYDGIVGAITGTRPENTVPAIRAILETMDELAAAAPTPDEVRTAVDRVVNGFVFNFETAAQVVSRTMFYEAEELPADWLERYLRGVQGVGPAQVHRAFLDHLRPERMSILVVGDPERIGRDALAALGPVTVLEVR